jgi:hypothetical protein
VIMSRRAARPGGHRGLDARRARAGRPGPFRAQRGKGASLASRSAM